jgi:signal transduction histidine kinase
VNDPRTLTGRLTGLQIGSGLFVVGIGFAIGPRLLSLDSTAGWVPLAIWGVALTIVCPSVVTFLSTRHLRRALEALSQGRTDVSASELRSIYSLAARLTFFGLVAVTVGSLCTLVPPLRPVQNDLPTQLTLILFSITLASVGSLPLYVLMRSVVGQVIEIAPPPAARAAIETLDARRRMRLQRRLLLAVAAPVGFVALGSSLLVNGHARASYVEAHQRDVEETVRGTLDAVGGDRAGVNEAIRELASYGVDVEVSSDPAPVRAMHDEHGVTELTVSLHQGHARVRFAGGPSAAITGVYALLALVATLLAGVLGGRIGEAFGQDIELARRVVATTGVADVLKGTKVQRDARFAGISTLLAAIDGLGDVFREFAAAQEMAIDAHAATERMRAMFLASMSHDLKGPLNSILGFAELVQRGKLTEGQRESTAIIEQRGRELLHLINTILDSARAEARELYISPEWTMVGDVVMAAVLDGRDLTVGGNVQVLAEIQPGVPKLFVDPARIAQALTGVIMTAVKLTAEGAVVQVSATLPTNASRLRVQIETAGGAHSAAEVEKMFEAFKYPERARQLGSLGLGLSLARSIFELHNGSIEIEATPNGGTVFVAWLPLAGERLSAQGLGSLRPPA